MSSKKEVYYVLYVPIVSLCIQIQYRKENLSELPQSSAAPWPQRMKIKLATGTSSSKTWLGTPAAARKVMDCHVKLAQLQYPGIRNIVEY